ncbi:porin [Oxalobacteraceae bacterium]|nr:porin [Oxalobacteraceae bacterium]
MPKLPVRPAPILFALLAASAPAAFAQSSAVQVYGILDLYAGSSNTSGAVSSKVLNNGGMTTSYWGIGGTESLGGTLSAIFALESVVRLDTGESGRFAGDTLFSRAAYVGLQDTWGTLKIGRVPNPLFQATGNLNPFGFSTRFAPLMTQLWAVPYGASVAADTGWSNAIHYTSPSFGNVSVVGQYALGETAGSNSNNNAALVVKYVGDTLALTLAGQRVKAGLAITPAAPSQTTWLVGGAYDLKVVKLFATADRNISDVSGRRTRTGHLGLSAPAGQGKLLFAWARSLERSNSKAGFSRDTATVGYDYNLSIRTDVYANLVYDKLSTAGSGNTGAIGIRHKF